MQTRCVIFSIHVSPVASLASVSLWVKTNFTSVSSNTYLIIISEDTDSTHHYHHLNSRLHLEMSVTAWLVRPLLLFSLSNQLEWVHLCLPLYRKVSYSAPAWMTCFDLTLPVFYLTCLCLNPSLLSCKSGCLSPVFGTLCGSGPLWDQPLACGEETKAFWISNPIWIDCVDNESVFHNAFPWVK